MVFYWSGSNSKFPQVSWTLLSFLVDLSDPVGWMVSTRPLISMSSIPFINPLVTILNAPITNGITVTFMFNRFFKVLKQGLGTYLSFRFPSVLPCGQPERQSPLWRSTLDSQKLQHYWSLTMRLFSVISRTLVLEGFIKDAVGLFYSLSRLGWNGLVHLLKKIVHMFIHLMGFLWLSLVTIIFHILLRHF